MNTKRKKPFICPETKKPCDMPLCVLIDCAIIVGRKNQQGLGLRNIFRKAGVKNI